MDIKELVRSILDKLSILDSEKERLSVTNITVLVFSSIVAFRTLFAGLHFTESHIDWTVQNIDVSSTLGFLFSLWNYNEKRKGINDNGSQDK